VNYTLQGLTPISLRSIRLPASAPSRKSDWRSCWASFNLTWPNLPVAVRVHEGRGKTESPYKRHEV